MSAENCQICLSAKFKYSCPKCNILYCSLECYKSTKHQLCSEEFYRKCVQDEMASSATISDNVQNMYKILKRIGNEQLIDENIDPNYDEGIDSDDDDDTDIAARLQGVNINDADEIWSRLTAEEKHEFESLVETGKITTLLPQFEPWWMKKETKKLIEDISDSEKPLQLNSHPEILKNIVPFENICKKEPSHCLQYNLCNILGAYTCTVLFFNGEHLLTPIEATKYTYMLSTNLNKNTNFDSDEEAVTSIILEGQLYNNGSSVQDYDTVFENIRNIREYSSSENEKYKIYILAALSDLWILFTAAKKKLSKIKENDQKLSHFATKFADFQTEKPEELSKDILKNLIKKIEYFLSFINKEST